MTLTFLFVMCAKAESSRWPPYVAARLINEKAGMAGGPHILTLLAHACKVMVEAPFVLNERGITVLMVLDPVADVLPQLEVVRGGAVQLVGQRAEKAVAVAHSVGSVKSELAQLGVEHLTSLFWVRHNGLDGGRDEHAARHLIRI